MPIKHQQDATAEQAMPRRAVPRGRVWLRRLFTLAGFFVFFLGVGFVLFLTEIDRFNSADQSNLRADAVVVLTGGFARLGPAVDLLRQKRGERLLISGVNRATSDRLLKDVLEIDDALYDCCVDVDQDALDTVGNAVGTAHWVSSKKYRSIIVVTNDYHMPRSLVELGRVLDGVELVPYAVHNAPHHDETFGQKLDRYRVLLGEYGKYVATLVRGIASGDTKNAVTVNAGLSTGW